MAFVHLRVHTQFSLLEGAIRIEELLTKVKELGMPAIAMTDTNNLFGAIEFTAACKAAGVKSILGAEVSFHPQGWNALLAATAKNTGAPPLQGPKFHPLILLAKNFQGYQNLCQILTRSYTSQPVPQKGQHLPAKALVDRELLEKYSEGLIVLSGCLRGEIPYKVFMGDEQGAVESLNWFKKRFGSDFYLELIDTGLPEQSQVNEALYRLGQKQGVKCVATANAHYLDPKDAEAQEVLQCIEGGRNLDFDRPKSLVPSEFYLKSEEVMRASFDERFPGACDETLVIAEQCSVQFPFNDEKGRTIYRLPNFRPDTVAKGAPFDLIEYFREQARVGISARFLEPVFAAKKSNPEWAQLEPKYRQRLEDELAMIERTGFSGYFLIVADFIQWAKNQEIPVGPGRGSGAGSIVAWSLKITDLDPIEFNLLFERFINPERISMPDFDVDFCQDRRGEVIDYVTRKYGNENVCQIITFGKLQARAAVKDVARVMGFSFAESDQITKLIPEELGIELVDAIQKEPRLREKMEQDPRANKIMEYALKLEGLSRSAGIHAAGVIITEEPVVTYCPLYVGREGERVCQYDKDSAEKIGLVKYDFLGLKTLTVIDNAIKLIRATAAPDSTDSRFTLDQMPYGNAAVFTLLASGDTDGVFQVESSGMKDLCVRMQPSTQDDLTAICALYRPGPLGSGMVDTYIECKHGRQAIAYEVDQLAPILSETYGVMLYQEQVMQVARDLAGYSLGQADLLRRAMGKKKPEEMAKQREIFIAGATQRGIKSEQANTIFDLMAKFADYGFNKSHSAAYGILTYQTGYLKAHYPAEFMAALMATEADNTDKITKYIANSKDRGIPVLPPDVNYSQKRFSVEWVQDPLNPDSDKKVRGIRFGLEAIKGVGGAAVDAILEARGTAKFENALNFVRRVSTRKVNKKVLESLTLAGAFDSIAERNRATLFGSLENLIEVSSDEQEERELGQSSLFDSFTSEEVKLVTPASAVFRDEPEWPRSKCLIEEKRVVGFYVSGHPMDTWQKICEEWLGWTIEKLKDFVVQKQAQKAAAPKVQEDSAPWMGGDAGGYGGRYRAPKTEVRLAGLLGEVREIMTKKGSRMAFAVLEDLNDRIEIVFFPEAFAQNEALIKKAIAEAEPVLLHGEVEIGEEAPKILVKSLEFIQEAHKGRVQQIVLRLDPARTTTEMLRALRKSLIDHRGKCPVRIEFHDSLFKTRLELPKTVGVSPTPQMVESIKKIFGRDVVQLQ